MRLVCLSDTHNLHDDIAIPDGDILIHAGDLTDTGLLKNVNTQLEILSKLPHKYKIFIAGNLVVLGDIESGDWTAVKDGENKAGRIRLTLKDGAVKGVIEWKAPKRFKGSCKCDLYIIA